MAVWDMRRVMSLAPFTLTGRHPPLCCLRKNIVHQLFSYLSGYLVHLSLMLHLSEHVHLLIVRGCGQAMYQQQTLCFTSILSAYKEQANQVLQSWAEQASHCQSAYFKDSALARCVPMYIIQGPCTAPSFEAQGTPCTCTAA